MSFRRLPEIQDELEKSIIRARDLLDGLPKPPSDDPRGEISSLLHTFTSDLAQEIRGVPDEDGLLQVIRPAQEKFRRAIRMTAPDFRPFEKKFRGTRKLVGLHFCTVRRVRNGMREARARVTLNRVLNQTFPFRKGERVHPKQFI